MRRSDESHSWAGLRRLLADGGASHTDLAQFDVVVSRRWFLGLAGRGSALLALSGFGAGTGALLDGLFGRGLIPVAWAQEDQQTTVIPGKPDMTVHIPRPVCGEFAPHLLSHDVTPTARHFVRNNGIVPERATNRDPLGWKLTIDGHVHRPLELSLDELKQMPSVSLPLMIECGGNGRALFDPPVRGNPWGRGAIGCSQWTGVRLRDVLERAGLKSEAKYTAHYGEDAPIGLAKPFSRGIPLDKAMEEHTLVAYGMNGEDLTTMNGYPVRLVVPGWVGSCSQKWLTRIWIRDREHDSQKMTGYSYRVPKDPVAPGTRPDKSAMMIAKSWPIKSMITRPAANTDLPLGKELEVAGHAWVGEGKVTKVLISADYGVHWQEATLTAPPNKYAWNRFEAKLTFPGTGYFEIWARAFDGAGNAQPFRQPWNPKGYLGNVIHRVPIQVTA